PPRGPVGRNLVRPQGSVRGSVIFDPRFDWTRPPERSQRKHGRLFCTWDSTVATLASTPDLSIEPGRPCALSLRPGESLTVVLGLDHREPAALVDPEGAIADLHRTDSWWRGWSAGLRSLAGGTEEGVCRSCLRHRGL